MIKQLFFPRTIKGKLLFSEITAGIAVDGNSVHVAHVHASRSGSTIKLLEEHAVNPGDPKTYLQRLGTTLKKVAPKIPKGAKVRVNFPSSKVVIKELTLPFLDADKIRMVVEYEIEPSLPFSLEKALIDFVIIEQSEVKQASTILVVAAQLEEVKKYLDAFQKAGIDPSIITIDVFGMADLFGRLPAYKKQKHDAALVDISANSTRITLLSDHALVATRTINSGSIAPGAEQSDKEQMAHLTKLFDEIAFTLNSFETKSAKPLEVEKIFYSGAIGLFEQFSEYCKDSLHLPCEQFATDKISSIERIKSALSLQPSAWHSYTRVLATALTSEQFEQFTLRQKEVQVSPKPFIQRQLITASALFIILLISIGTKGFMDIRDLNGRLKVAQQREVKKLRSVFNEGNSAKKKSNIKQLARAAEEHVQEQEEIWAPFAKMRLRPLEILQELCLVFNRKKFDLTIQEVLISGDDQEPHPIEVHGLFRSKTGSDHFKHFSELENDVRNSKILVLTEEIDPTPAEKGVQFIVRLKQREE